MLVAASNDSVKPAVTDESAGYGKHSGQNNGGHAFKAVVTVGMILVWGFAGNSDADNHDDGADHVGGRVHRIGHHGAGMGNNSSK